MKKLYLLLIGLCLLIQLRAQVSRTIHITAGTLSSVFTAEENSTITSLTITGTIDDRDVETLQYGFPLLTELDLSGTTMVAVQMDGFTSKPNWWPGPTLSRNSANYGGLHKPSLTGIQLPSTLEVIGYRGFDGCSGLKAITIPPTVIYIGEAAFESCTSLTSVTLPPSEIGIYPWAFANCTALTELPLLPNWTGIDRLLFANCTGFTNLAIPAGIRSIGYSAFIGCTSITTLTLPESVEYIDHIAFAVCPDISAIYSYNPVPPLMYNAFSTSVYTNGTLYVPFGSKALYAAADGPIDGWKQFQNIVEMAGMELSAKELSMEAAPATRTIEITTTGRWSAVCDKEWLTVSPASGDSTQMISLTALENMASADRTSTVTFSAANGYLQAVTITQKARINTMPVAIAGQDQWVEEGELVQLDGSASTDADNDTLAYEWSAPDGITLSSASDARPAFTAPITKMDTTYTFILVVNDGKETSVSDSVNITITNKTIELGLSANTVAFESKESSAKIIVTGNAQWSIISDQPWLSVSPLAGEGEGEIISTALANETTTERIATVTISAPETDEKTITVTQQGLVTGVGEITSLVGITCYPNPFSQEMAIGVANPSHKAVTVDIYSISGEKIRSLARAQKETKISLTWDGTNEQGKKVPYGMYILKMNGVERKVVFGR